MPVDTFLRHINAPSSLFAIFQKESFETLADVMLLDHRWDMANLLMPQMATRLKFATEFARVTGLELHL